MRISDWSSDVCSSDLGPAGEPRDARPFDHVHLRRRVAGRRLASRALLRAGRSEERRVGKECVVRVDLGGRRIIKKKTNKVYRESMNHIYNKTTEYKT